MEACHEHPRIPNLFFLSAPTVYVPEDSGFKSIRDIFGEIRNEFDFCFADSPSGVGTGFRLATTGADMTIIVTNSELPAMRDAQRAAEAARDLGVSELRLLVNRALPGSLKDLSATIDAVIDSVGVQLLGVIREDASVTISLHQNTPLVLHDKRLAAYDFLDVARRIAGEYIPLRFMRFT
jgi:septum site-determining protein MinD